ncbi:MAG: endonuclease/exonuclease/phosphatase family metal-dependent hydrolase [Natronomonas sp.]|jgi:endonuclease/exonuclease/phosphatase family metal-dependent hydrolase|uniref:endonuclease/exonuclease/phosphatase family protein n=1 Tax=Natronomonas sp. TaxID=2184060 RepID=UPI003988D3BC
MTVRLLSYNVRYAELDTGTDVWPERRDGVASVIAFHDPDIICLQEVWQGQLDDFRERLPAYEWACIRAFDGEHTPIGYRPERFDVLEHSAFSLSETPDDLTAIDWDSAIPRVTTEATFHDAESDEQFAVISTHFDHVSEAARERSAELLADRIADRSIPTLLAGDFNCTPEDTPYETLTDAGLADARTRAEAPHGPETTFNHFEGARPEKRIDHVFLPESVGVERFGVRTDLDARARYPSDHFAVLVECALP